ncbi:MAG: hypothetical protein RL095_1786 [Verrucomicrobiota bacterium]|jgi:ribosomal protein S18 acetylase RimI-like enzyme
MNIRPATLADLDDLVALEEASFNGDRMSRRSWSHAVRAKSIAVLVAPLPEGGLGGCAVLFFRRGSGEGRIYSIAVAAAARGRGLGRLLVAAAEEAARRRACTSVRAEIRIDNSASRALFAGCGYHEYGGKPGYYEDGQDAVLIRRRLS